MSEILSLQNFPERNIAQDTESTADAARGGTSVNIKNAEGFTSNKYAFLGNEGSEIAEIRKISTVTTKVLNFVGDALLHNHKKGIPILSLRGNQIKLYRATAPSDNSRPVLGDFSLLVTLDIHADEIETLYKDSIGSSDYWYLYTFYDETAATETTKDVSEAQRGGDYGHFASVYEVREEAGFQDADYVEDIKIRDARDDAESIIKGKLHGKYTLPITNTPRILTRITRLIGAGLLMQLEYGAGAQSIAKEGIQKYEAGLKLLDDITSGAISLIIETDGVEENFDNTGDHWPDDDNSDVPDRIFSINDEY